MSRGLEIHVTSPKMAVGSPFFVTWENQWPELDLQPYGLKDLNLMLLAEQ